MNTGQRLVELSGLPSGSALTHFAAIVLGSGGTGEARFAHRMGVVSKLATVEISTVAPRQPEGVSEHGGNSEICACDQDVSVLHVPATAFVLAKHKGVSVFSKSSFSINLLDGDKGVRHVV